MDFNYFDIELVCDLEYQAAERGIRDCYGLPTSPDWPSSAILTAAYIRDVDVITLIDKTTRALIEESCCISQEGG